MFVAQGGVIEIVDIDTKEVKMIMQDAVRAIVIDYLWEDDSVFWLDQDGTLMKASLDGTNKTKVSFISNNGFGYTFLILAVCHS